MKHPKPITAYCAVAPEGEMIFNSCRTYKDQAIIQIEYDTDINWKRLYKLGYRIIKIEIKVSQK